MDAPIEIRDAVAADAPRIAAMARALSAAIESGPGALTEAHVRADLLGRPGIALLAAGAPGAPVGYALTMVAYETAYAARGAYVSDLYVDAAHRRRGVARALLAEAARRAQAAGGIYLWLVSGLENAGANAAYDRLGATRDRLFCRAIHGAPFERLAAP